MPRDNEKPAATPRNDVVDTIKQSTQKVVAAVVDSDQNIATMLSDGSVRIWPHASDKGTYELFLRSATADPSDTKRKRNLVLACWNYGRQRQAADDRAAARRLLTQGLELLGRLPPEAAAAGDPAKWRAEFEGAIRSLGEAPNQAR